MRGCEVGFKGKGLIGDEVKEVTLISKGDYLEVKGPSSPCNCEVCIEGEGLVALPGMIDAHVHVRDWDLSYKETIETASKAALKGGVVAFFDMPNTSPKVNTYALVKKRIEDFEKRSYVDFGLYVSPNEDLEEFERILELPIAGVKLFPQDYAFADFLSKRDVLVVVHPEDPLYIKESPTPGERGVARNPIAELKAVESLSEIISRVHFTHLSTPEAVRRAKERNKGVDSTPHHLMLNSNKERELECFAKVNPPLRPELIQRELLKMFLEGPWVVVTDHAPHAAWEKELDFSSCPPGFPGLEVALPLLLRLFRLGLVSLYDVVKAYSELPAKMLGLWPRLGVLRTGSLASFTIVKLEEWPINPETFESKAKFSPFEGFPAFGEVVATVIRGKLAYFAGELKKIHARNLADL